MRTSPSLTVVAYATVVVLMLCLVAVLANDALLAEKLALGTPVHW